MEWTTEKPNRPGWYWVREDRRYGMAYVRQETTADGFKYLWVEAMYPGFQHVSMDVEWWPTSEWSGPIDPPFLVTRLCNWEAGCNIPMQQVIEEPASLCLWHQACLKSPTPRVMAGDRAQFEAWINGRVAPPEPWGRGAEVLWPVTVGKREL